MKAYLLKEKNDAHGRGVIISVFVCNNDNPPPQPLQDHLNAKGYELAPYTYDYPITIQDWEEMVREHVYFQELGTPEEPEKG